VLSPSCAAWRAPFSVHADRLREQDSNPRLLLFAGGNVTTVFNDVHVLDLETLAWSAPGTAGHAPPPRAGHGADLLPDGLLLVWGGGSVGQVCSAPPLAAGAGRVPGVLLTAIL